MVDDGFGDVGELFVGGAFFVEGFLEKVGDVLVAELLGEGAGTAVGGDFVVLDALSGTDEGGVEDFGGEAFLHHLFALFDEAFHGFALLDSGVGDVELVEDFFEALDLAFGFFEVGLEGCFQVFVGGGFGHFWQGLGELLFGTVKVFEFELKQVFESFGFHGFFSVGLLRESASLQEQ